MPSPPAINVFVFPASSELRKHHMKSLLNILLSILKYSYRQAENRHAGDFVKKSERENKEVDDDGDGLRCVQWSHQKASVVCEALLSQCIPSPSTTHARSLLTLSLSFHHSQPSPQFPGSFMSLLMLQRTTHLQSISPARRSRLAQRSSLR